MYVNFILLSRCHAIKRLLLLFSISSIAILFSLVSTISVGRRIGWISNKAPHGIDCSSSCKMRSPVRQNRNVYGAKKRLSWAVHTCGVSAWCSMLMPMMIFQSVRILFFFFVSFKHNLGQCIYCIVAETHANEYTLAMGSSPSILCVCLCGLSRDSTMECSSAMQMIERWILH